MARDKRLEQYLGGEGRLFQSSGETAGLNLDQLTPEQAIALARQGRTQAAGGGEGAQRIGSQTATERSILGAAGSQLASGDTLVVPNVQKRKGQRMDVRSRGGDRAALPSAERGTTETRGVPTSSPSITGPVAAGMGGGGLPIGKFVQKGIKKGLNKLKDNASELSSELPHMQYNAADLQAMADKNLSQTGGTQYGQADVAGLAKGLASRVDLASMGADPLIGPQSLTPEAGLAESLSGQTYANPFSDPSFGTQMASGSGGGVGAGLGGFAGTGIGQAAGGGATAAGTGLSTGGVVGQTVGAGQTVSGLGSIASGLGASALAYAVPAGMAMIAGKILMSPHLLGQERKDKIGTSQWMDLMEGREVSYDGKPVQVHEGRYVVDPSGRDGVIDLKDPTWQRNMKQHYGSQIKGKLEGPTSHSRDKQHIMSRNVSGMTKEQIEKAYDTPLGGSRSDRGLAPREDKDKWNTLPETSRR